MKVNHWCNKCSKRHSDFKILKKEKGKTGSYRPYRDTLEKEPYTYTEITKKCNGCGKIIKIERDQVYHISESDMEKFGYHGANYGT